MTLSRREHPEARNELREAAKWYDDEVRGLGDDFITAIDEALRHIVEWPLAAPAFPGWDETPPIRHAQVRAFPYRVVYYVSDTSIVIVAYAHQRREPGYWQHRLLH